MNTYQSSPSSSLRLEDSSFQSIEVERGAGFHRPSFLYQVSPLPSPPREELIPDYLIPVENRRRVPGCGINHHDLFDVAVAAETDPFEIIPAQVGRESFEDIFDQFVNDPRPDAFFSGMAFTKRHFQRQVYHNRNRMQQRSSRLRFQISDQRRFQSSASMLFGTSQLHGEVNLAHFGMLSPANISSSSSSSSSSDEEIQPMAASSFLRTPRHVVHRYHSETMRNNPEVRSHYFRTPSPPNSPPGSGHSSDEGCLSESPIPRSIGHSNYFASIREDD